MNTHDKTVGFFDKVSHIIAYSYIAHFVCGLLAYDGRNWWTEYSVTWYRGAINFFLSSFAIAINSILVCIFMKKVRTRFHFQFSLVIFNSRILIVLTGFRLTIF